VAGPLCLSKAKILVSVVLVGIHSSTFAQFSQGSLLHKKTKLAKLKSAGLLPWPRIAHQTIVYPSFCSIK
jgi:hypothetical protein